jgi:hypothetical protein
MGHRMHQPLAILCVTSSLALVTLGSADPSSGFHLQTLSFSRPPPAIEGPIGDMASYIPCCCSWSRGGG